MKLFRYSLYANSKKYFESAKGNLFTSAVAMKYPNCIQYFNKLWNLKESRACCFWENIIIGGSYTTKSVEAQFLVTIDTILKRQRQYNINMLFTKLKENFEHHFRLHLLQVADEALDGIHNSRVKVTAPYSLIGDVTKI